MKKRIVYFDYLRVLAALAVILLHVSSFNWDHVSGKSLSWNVMNGFDSLVRWGVPIFLMISGPLFLSREVDIKKLYTKNILRLLVAYITWSVFYAAADVVMGAVFDNNMEISVRDLAGAVIDGSHHMWFIPMMIGIYICIPLLKSLVSTEKNTVYFLLLGLTFAFVLPQIVLVSNDYVGGTVTVIINKLSGFVKNMNMDLVLGYGFYFVLGYYLDKRELTAKQRCVVYAMGALGFVSTALLNAGIAWRTNEPYAVYFDNFKVNVLLEAVAVHTLIKYRKYENEKLNAIVAGLAQYSFGTYLVHIFIIKLLSKFGLSTLSFWPILSVPVIFLITAVVSFGVSFVINKIPKIGKWIS